MLRLRVMSLHVNLFLVSCRRSGAVQPRITGHQTQLWSPCVSMGLNASPQSKL